MKQIFEKNVPNFKLKVKNQDFQVFESYAVNQVSVKGGKFQHCLLLKSDFSTFDAIEKIAEIINVRAETITYFGLKDEKAYTQQLISLELPYEKFLKKLEKINFIFKENNDKFIRLKYLYTSENPLKIGRNIGNSFLITMRDLSKDTADKLKEIKGEFSTIFLNYYGHQRFGLPGNSSSTHLIGECLLNQEYKKAFDLFLKNQDILGIKTKELNLDPKEFFEKLDFRRKNFFINSYYSYQWNNKVDLYLKDNKIKTYDYKANDFNIKIIENIEEISYKFNENYIIFNTVDSIDEGNSEKIIEVKRKIFSPVSFAIFNIREDDVFSNKYAASISFFLGKGSYATIAIPQFLGQVAAESN